MPDNNTIQQQSAKLWWESLTNKIGYDLTIRYYPKCNQYELTPVQIENIYNKEHPVKSPTEFERDMQERKESVEDEIIKAAREQFANVGYSSNENALSLYCAGARFTYSYIKHIDPTAIESMNAEYLKLKGENEKLREALQRICNLYDNVEDTAGKISREILDATK